MPRSRRPLALLTLALLASRVALAQDLPKPDPARPSTPAVVPDGQPVPPPDYPHADTIKPLPPVAIPDDPPPHEGAFFELPLTIEPPDIIIVEVLEAMVGRPITGERLVRPDGTISLGFYGDVYVRGLSPSQAKTKIVLHLRNYLNDETLGLKLAVGGLEAEPEMVPPDEVEMVPPNDGRNPPEAPNNGRNPFDLEKAPGGMPRRGGNPPAEKGPEVKPEEADQEAVVISARVARKRSQGQRTNHRPRRLLIRDSARVDRQDPAREDRALEPKPNREDDAKLASPPPDAGPDHFIKPEETARVFVDFSAHNSKVYFVQGEVGVPGRLPITGKETVLDALNYAGGLVPNGEPADIHLYRPARGGKPAKDYRIDLDAIRKGEAKANLQIFSDDRLVVGRNAIVQKTIEIDRAAGLVNSVMNSILQYSVSSRTLGAMSSPPTINNDALQLRINGQNLPTNMADPKVMTQAQREAAIKEWAEFLWSVSSRESGAMLDEKAFHDALMKKFSPAPAPK